MATFQDNVFIDGNLDVKGSVLFTDIGARDLLVTGVGSITTLEANVGIITVANLGITTTYDITVYNQLKDTFGQVGAADSILATVGGKLTWTRPDLVGIATGFDTGNTFYVSANGNDSNSGVTFEKPFKTIAYALTQISPGANQILQVSAGEYEETFPLSIPIGVTVRGAGQRATLLKPTVATETNDCFLLDDRTTVEDMTIGGMYKPAGAANNNYAFRFKTGADIQNRSPYVQRVTVINRGTQVTASDPYGYGSADAYPTTAPGGAGVLVDGSVVTSASLEAAILLNEVTIFPAGNIGIEITNGGRVEWLNGFIYFASEGLKGKADLTTGLAGAGKARLTLDNASGGLTPGNDIIYYDSDGTTQLASGTIDSVSGNYVYLTNAGVGTFAVPRNRSAKGVSFVDGAQITTALQKFGTASLDCTSSSTDAINIDTNADFGFGTGDFTIDFWVYQTSTSNNKTFLDMRKANDSDVALSLQEKSGAVIHVEISGSAVITGTQALSVNSWHHVALTREGSTLRLFVDGIADGSVSNSTDLGLDAPFRLGDKHDNSGGIPGFFDEVRVQKGVAKYTAAFTPPTSEYQGDKDTVLLLHFNDANGSTSTTDDILVYQDIRITGGNTADKVTLADYHEFGADLRSVACAIEYGNKGLIGDGNGVTLRVISINFNHIGALGDISNDPNLAIQANEVTELNGGEVSYVSIDQNGDLRVGDAFFVNQETGEVSFQDTVTDLTALSSLTITNGTQSSVITPTSGRFGNVLISGQSVESVTGDLDLKAAGNGEINIYGNTNVIGILTAQVVEINAIQNGNTSIALDDTGVGSGTIRFNTDGTEAMRLDESQNLGIGTQTPRSDLDVMNQTRLEDLFVSGIATIGGAEITPGGGGAISVKELNVSGVATINVGLITEAVIGVATITNADITFANITESVTGLATITDLVGAAATIGVLDVTTITIDGIDAEVAVIRDLTVTGFSTLADMTAEDATFDSITVTDLSVTGPTTATSIEATSITTPVANITDATVGTSTVTTANVGFVTFIDAVGTALTVYTIEAFSGKFDIIEFGSGGGGGGTGIDSTSVVTENLLVTGIATFTTGFTTHLTAEGISAGVVTVTDIVSSGVSTLATIKNVDLTVSGVATINHEEVGSSVIGVATITSLDATTVNIDGIDADVVVTDDLVAGVATITKLEATDTVGTAATFQNLNFTSGVGTHLVLVSEEVGVSTIGILSATEVVITNLVVTGDTNLGVSSGIVIIDGPATISGVVTIGDNSITLDGRQGREYIELGTGSGVRIAGLNTITDTQSYVQVFNGLFTNLNVGGISTLGSVGVSTLTVSELTVDEITATDAVVGTATITTAEIGDASVGFITATDIVATALTSHRGNFDILEFGEGPSGGGTGIDSTSIKTENLLITGIATINSGIFTSIQSENINVSGTTTSVNIDATTIDTTNLTAEVGAITNLVNGNLVSTGIATLNDAIVGVLTVANLDANVISIDNVDADNAVIGLATITEELVGISTIGFADITDAQIGAATITNLSATTIDIDGIDGKVGRLVDLEVTGIATIADLEAGNTRLGITTVTGFLDVVGYTTVSGDLTIGGNLQVDGDLSYGRNANITGVGTVNHLNWTTAVGGALTVTSLNVLGDANLNGSGIVTSGSDVEFRNLSITGLSTFVGVATFQDDLYVGGNLYVEGDLAYDEVNGRNANITGIGTVNVLNWNDAVGGALTITDIYSDDIATGEIDTFKLGVTSTAFIDGDFLVSGVTTFVGSINATGISTITTLNFGDSVGTSLTVTNLDADNISFNGNITGDIIITEGLSVSGVATINELEFNNAVGGALTATSGDFTDISVSGIATIAHLEATTINAGIVTAGRFIGVGSELSYLPPAAFTTSIPPLTRRDGTPLQSGDFYYDDDDLRTFVYYIDTNSAQWVDSSPQRPPSNLSIVSGLGSAGVTSSIVNEDLGYLEFESGTNINATISSTPTGNQSVVVNIALDDEIELTNLNVTGVATIQSLNVGEIGIIGGGGLDVEKIETDNLLVTGLSTFIGVSTFKGDVYIDGNLIVGDQDQDVISGTNLFVTGIATIGTLGVTTDLSVAGFSTFAGDMFVGGIATITTLKVGEIETLGGGGLNVDTVTTNDLVVTGLSTFVGVATFQSDIYIGGNLNIEGDLSYDEVNGRNANITGVGTVNRLYVTTDADVDRNFRVAGIATLNIADIPEANIGILTVTGSIELPGGGGINGDVINTENLTVSGIATIAHLEATTINAGIVTAGRFIGVGSELSYLPSPAFSTDTSPTIRRDGTPLQDGDLYYDSADLRTYVYYIDSLGPQWVDAAPQAIIPDLKVVVGPNSESVDLSTGYLDIQDVANETLIGITSISAGIPQVTIGLSTDVTVSGNLNVVGIATVGTLSAGDISLNDINATGSVSIGGSLTMEPAPTGVGGVYFNNSIVGMGTALIIDDAGVGGNLSVVGGANIGGNIAGAGGTISGFSDITSPLVRSNLVSSLQVDTNYLNTYELLATGVSTFSNKILVGSGVTIHTSGDAEFVGVVTAGGVVTGTLEVLEDASINRNLSVGGASTIVGDSTTFGDATFKQDVIIEGSLFTAGGGGGISTDGSTGITSTSISTQDLYVSGIATAQTADILGDLLVRGNARVVGVVTAENFDSLSDIRYKENIRPIENALDKVADLNGIHFDYKHSGNKSMGLIAQDVQKVFPNAVNGEDPISVNYNGIIGALVEAVKELKDQNEQLRKDIDELKKS